MEKSKGNCQENSKDKKVQEQVRSIVEPSASNKIENQNQTYNSKKEGLGPNGKR